MSVKIKRSVYADMFGPTTGDRVRLVPIAGARRVYGFRQAVMGDL